MKYITVRTPLGDCYQNPSSAIIKDFIFKEGDDFWQVGCAELPIYFYDENNPNKEYSNSADACLVLASIEEFGVKVRHRIKDDKYLNLKFGEHTGEMIEMMDSAGDGVEYYREYLVPKELAWEAVKYFLETGDRKPNLTWEEEKDTPSTQSRFN